jgi:hypothetical protein
MIGPKRLDAVHDDGDPINVDRDCRQREKLTGIERPYAAVPATRPLLPRRWISTRFGSSSRAVRESFRGRLPMRRMVLPTLIRHPRRIGHRRPNDAAAAIKNIAIDNRS